jgi:hypothetical protein
MNSGRRPPLKTAAAAGSLLRQLLGQWGLDRKLREYRAWELWDEVVGPQIAARARPAKLRDGVLEVVVDQAVWMQQLQLMKPKILSSLNARLGEVLIRDIFWRRGRVEAMKAAGVARRAPAPPPLPPLNKEELSTIEEVLAPLDDPAVRESLGGVLRRQARLKKARKDLFSGESGAE